MSLIKNALILGAGYVLGAHAGRPRYEQLKQQATKLLQRPEVKQAGNRAKDAVAQKLPGGGTQDDTSRTPSGRSWRRPRGEKAATWGVGAAQTSPSAVSTTPPPTTAPDLDGPLSGPSGSATSK